MQEQIFSGPFLKVQLTPNLFRSFYFFTFVFSKIVLFNVNGFLQGLGHLSLLDLEPFDSRGKHLWL